MPALPRFPAVRFPGAVPFPALAFPIACAGYFWLRYRSPAYLCGAALVLAGHFLLLAFWRRLPAARLGRAAFCAAALGLPLLGTWQFLNLADLGDLDQAAYTQALWNLGHGHLDFDFHGRHLFGIHSQYTAALWAPVLALGGDLGLKLGNGLCLVAAALLFVFRFREDRGAAWWAGLLLLLSPPVASQFFFGFHPEMLAAPLLALALAAYRKGKPGAFLACAALLACTKETLTLAAGGVLILAVIERRSWRWWLLPGLACSALMALYWFVAVPRFAPAGNPLGFFLPAPRDIPAHWARPQVLAYLWHIYLPALPLAAAAPKRYLILPLPLMAFYAAFPDPLFMVMWPNYAFPLAILAAGSLVLRPGLRLGLPPAPGAGPAAPASATSASSGGTPETGPFAPAPDAGRASLRDERHPAPRAAFLDERLLAAGAVIALLSYPTWREVFSIPGNRLDKARQVAELRKGIPDTASVIVNGPFHARLAARREVAVWGWNRNPLGHYDYAVVDTSYHVYWLVDRGALASGLAELSDTAAWAPQYAAGDLRVYRRRGPRLARAEVPILDPLEPARRRYAPGQRTP